MVCPSCAAEIGEPTAFSADFCRCPQCLSLIRSGPAPASPAVEPHSDAGATALSAEPSRPALPQPTEPIEVALRVHEGPDEGRLYRARAVEVVIGRGVGEVPLQDGKVSRQHTSLSVLEGRFLVRDLGSTNGTFVDGLRVGEAFVATGQMLVVGDTRMEIEELHVADSDRRA